VKLVSSYREINLKILDDNLIKHNEGLDFTRKIKINNYKEYDEKKIEDLIKLMNDIIFDKKFILTEANEKNIVKFSGAIIHKLTKKFSHDIEYLNIIKNFHIINNENNKKYHANINFIKFIFLIIKKLYLFGFNNNIIKSEKNNTPNLLNEIIYNDKEISDEYYKNFCDLNFKDMENDIFFYYDNIFLIIIKLLLKILITNNLKKIGIHSKNNNNISFRNQILIEKDQDYFSKNDNRLFN
jgi:hypothetical protein